MRHLYLLASLLGSLLVWQGLVSAQLVPAAYFPGPVATFQALYAGLLSGEFSRAAVQTFSRAVLGVIAATALGLVLALLTARYRRLRQAFDPLAEFFRPLPPAALVPIAIFFLGLGWALHAFILIFACLWPVYLNAASALQSVSSVQLRTAAMFGYEGWSRVLRVQFPSALPQIFIGIRSAAGISLIATVVTEMLAGRDGLGYVLNDAATTLRIPDMFACLLLLMVGGLTMNGLVLALRRQVVGWHEGMTASNRS